MIIDHNSAISEEETYTVGDSRPRNAAFLLYIKMQQYRISTDTKMHEQKVMDQSLLNDADLTQELKFFLPHC
jgi:hypothetical protein